MSVDRGERERELIVIRKPRIRIPAACSRFLDTKGAPWIERMNRARRIFPLAGYGSGVTAENFLRFIGGIAIKIRDKHIPPRQATCGNNE